MKQGATESMLNWNATLLLRWRRCALGGFALAALAAVAPAFAEHSFDHLLRGWLLGLLLTFGCTAGALALSMLHDCTGGRWGEALRPVLRAMGCTLPLVLLYWLVIAFNLNRLYLWAQAADLPTALAHGLINKSTAQLLAHKQLLLNGRVFVAVSLICFAVWALLAISTSRNPSEKEIKNNNVSRPSVLPGALALISGPGLVVHVLMSSVVVLLWMMSLDVHWSSAVFGLQFVVSQCCTALAVGTWMVLAGPRRGQQDETVQRDMARFLFAFVVLGAYLAFSEFLIAWSANLPDEVAWFLNRSQGGWSGVVLLDWLAAWAVPFALLLPGCKGHGGTKRLRFVCAWLIAAQGLHLFWMIEPCFADAVRNLHGSVGLLEYVLVPSAMFALWFALLVLALERSKINAQIMEAHIEED